MAGGSGGSGPSAAMGAIVAALEGLTKEVGKVRVRTAQLAERSHSTEGRLTYLEDHVTKIRSKMKQIRVRLWCMQSVSCSKIDSHSTEGRLTYLEDHVTKLQDEADLGACLFKNIHRYAAELHLLSSTKPLTMEPILLRMGIWL